MIFYKVTKDDAVMWVAYSGVDTTVEATLLKLENQYGWTFDEVSSEEFIPY